MRQPQPAVSQDKLCHQLLSPSGPRTDDLTVFLPLLWVTLTPLPPLHPPPGPSPSLEDLHLPLNRYNFVLLLKTHKAVTRMEQRIWGDLGSYVGPDKATSHLPWVDSWASGLIFLLGFEFWVGTKILFRWEMLSLDFYPAPLSPSNSVSLSRRL